MKRNHRLFQRENNENDSKAKFQCVPLIESFINQCQNNHPQSNQADSGIERLKSGLRPPPNTVAAGIVWQIHAAKTM